MKLIILWLINTIFVLPLKIITILFKLIYKIIKNIYFNNLDLEYINTMDGHDFEYFTKTLLEKNGFKQVNVSQSSSDYGIDVFAIKAVQEAKSGCEYYQCDIPVVFTNNTFSSAAINLAKNTNVELWDQDTLYHYLKKSKILTKSLPLYYPLFTFITTAILSYYYLQHQDYLLIPLLINMFLFISIIVKILKDKKKTPIILKEPEYTNALNKTIKTINIKQCIKKVSGKILITGSLR